jgi:hypothetical protein
MIKKNYYKYKSNTDITSVGVAGAIFSGLMGAVIILKFNF